MRKNGVDEKTAFAAMMAEVSDSEGSSDSESDSRPQPKQSSAVISTYLNADSKSSAGAKQDYKSGTVGAVQGSSYGRAGSRDDIQDAIENFGTGMGLFLFRCLKYDFDEFKSF